MLGFSVNGDYIVVEFTDGKRSFVLPLCRSDNLPFRPTAVPEVSVDKVHIILTGRGQQHSLLLRDFLNSISKQELWVD